MTNPYIYESVTYRPDDIRPIADYLKEHPDEKGPYKAHVLGAIGVMMEAGDFRSAKEALSIACRVLAVVRKSHGEPVIE